MEGEWFCGNIHVPRKFNDEIEDVEEQKKSSFFNYQIIQLWLKFSEVTSNFNFFFYCSAETEIHFFTSLPL